MSLSLDEKIKEISNRKMNRKREIVSGTLERIEATEKELSRLRKKRDNLIVQIESLEAKQKARRAQLENLVK